MPIWDNKPFLSLVVVFAITRWWKDYPANMSKFAIQIAIYVNLHIFFVFEQIHFLWNTQSNWELLLYKWNLIKNHAFIQDRKTILCKYDCQLAVI